MESTIATWQYFRYLTGAGHFMTELVADLEIELRKRNITIQNKTQPGDPPALPADGGGMCWPPDRCIILSEDLIEYASELRNYVNQVFQLTTEHVTAARERGVTEFSYRIVATPVNPKK